MLAITADDDLDGDSDLSRRALPTDGVVEAAEDEPLELEDGEVDGPGEDRTLDGV
jgi:hypothetical protein